MLFCDFPSDVRLLVYEQLVITYDDHAPLRAICQCNSCVRAEFLQWLRTRKHSFFHSLVTSSCRTPCKGGRRCGNGICNGSTLSMRLRWVTFVRDDQHTFSVRDFSTNAHDRCIQWQLRIAWTDKKFNAQLTCMSKLDAPVCIVFECSIVNTVRTTTAVAKCTSKVFCEESDTVHLRDIVGYGERLSSMRFHQCMVHNSFVSNFRIVI